MREVLSELGSNRSARKGTWDLTHQKYLIMVKYKEKRKSNKD